MQRRQLIKFLAVCAGLSDTGVLNQTFYIGLEPAQL